MTRSISNPNEYELANEVKRVSFQDGELAGLGTDDDHYFEVNFDSKTREFENYHNMAIR